MRDLLRHLHRSTAGTAAVEFGMLFPVFLVVMLGMLEFGNYLNQMTMLEKAVRAGGMYASRQDSEPADETDLDQTAITNIVMTGDPNDSTTFILQGWDDSKYPSSGISNFCGAQKLCIDVVSRSGTDPVSGTSETVNVIKLYAVVPYDPIALGALELLGFSGLTMKANHEQAWIGS